MVQTLIMDKNGYNMDQKGLEMNYEGSKWIKNNWKLTRSSYGPM